MSKSSTISPIPFDGKDFSLWKIKADAYMAAKGWTDIVMEGKASKAEEKVEDLTDRKAKAFSFLVTSLNSDTLSLFRAHTPKRDPHALWTAMVQHYERDTAASKHAIRAMMMSQRLGEGEDISVYVSRINSYSERLTAMHVTFGDGELLFYLLNGLPQE